MKCASCEHANEDPTRATCALCGVELKSDDAPRVAEGEGRGVIRGGAAAVLLIVLGVLAALLLLAHGATPLGTVHGRALGDVQRVVLADAQRGVVVEGKLDQGAYACPIPRSATAPVIVIHGAGGSLVRSSVVALEDTEMPLLGLWSAELRSREEKGVLRFDWAPVPKGEGYPGPRRYSLLFTYVKADGTRGEASLLSREPYMTLPVLELEELLKDWNPAERLMEVSLRAFEPGEAEGALWVATQVEWSLPGGPQGGASQDR